MKYTRKDMEDAFMLGAVWQRAAIENEGDSAKVRKSDFKWWIKRFNITKRHK